MIMGLERQGKDSLSKLLIITEWNWVRSDPPSLQDSNGTALTKLAVFFGIPKAYVNTIAYPLAEKENT